MDNLAKLTHSHTVIAAKKRAKRQQISEIIFDDNARRSVYISKHPTFFLTHSRDFLTGFHKRKLAKADAARKKAQERQKQIRLEARREVDHSPL